MENIILEELVRLIGKQQPAEFLATLKSENGEWKPEAEIKKTVAETYSGRLKEVVDEQKGRAVRERMTQAEKYLREKYGIESGDTLEDRIAKLVEVTEAKGGKEKIVEKTVELDEAGVKKHPAFQKLLKDEVVERLSSAEKERDEWKTKYAAYIEQQERERLESALKLEAINVLTAIRAALDKDEAKREKQINMFVAGLRSQFKFKLDENGKPYPVNANGEPLENGSFARITYSDLVKQENVYGVHQYDPEKNSPSPTSQQPGANQQQRILNGTGAWTSAQYMDRLKEAKTEQEKQAIRDTYKKQMAEAQAGQQ